MSRRRSTGRSEADAIPSDALAATAEVPEPTVDDVQAGALRAPACTSSGEGMRGGGVVASHVPEFQFELYVAGDGIRSRKAIETLTTMCDERLAGRYELSVIDVLVDPERAEHAKILATPTLVRRRPAPDVRVIGDLTLTRSVLAKLGVPAEGAVPMTEHGRES